MARKGDVNWTYYLEAPTMDMLEQPATRRTWIAQRADGTLLRKEGIKRSDGTTHDWGWKRLRRPNTYNGADFIKKLLAGGFTLLEGK